MLQGESTIELLCTRASIVVLALLHRNGNALPLPYSGKRGRAETPVRCHTRKVLPATFTQWKTGGRVFYSGVNLAGSTLLVVYIFRDNVVCALEVNHKVTLHGKSTMRE